MIGAIIGDVVGSIYEFNNIYTKNFNFFSPSSFPTDDTIMTVAVAKAVMESKPDHSDLAENAVKWMQKLGRDFPDRGYGLRFSEWLCTENPQPYNSYGNGSAMRVSPVAYAAKTLDEALEMSDLVTAVTHNHPEGLKGARATTTAIWMARHKENKGSIMAALSNYYSELSDPNFTLDKIRPSYRFSETCQKTVPQAIQAFYEAVDFEDAIRNAISLGGDSDTIGAITGAIAGAYYPIPRPIVENTMKRLDAPLQEAVKDFVLFTESFN